MSWVRTLQTRRALFHIYRPVSHDLLQYAAIERLDKAIERIQASIEEDGGELVVKMKVIQAPY